MLGYVDFIGCKKSLMIAHGYFFIEVDRLHGSGIDKL